MARYEKFMTDDARWRAVSQRDTTAAQAFVYAVRTTGIFCRPGCASRLPRPENVEYFETAEQAARAGYRACKRCDPEGVRAKGGSAGSSLASQDLMVRACRRIEEAEEPPSLMELAEEAGMSLWRFQRLFKKTVGVTPKQYAAHHQVRRFSSGLASGVSVTEALHGAGYGSTSRAHHAARNRLAMTPSAYKAGAPGERIRYGIAPCFLGWAIVAATPLGVCAVEFADEPDGLPALIQARFPRACLEKAGSDFSALLQEVVAAVESGQTEAAKRIPLDIRGTAFQERVWAALRTIQPGDTVSYGELAERLGKPKAVRAVAGACAANKIGVLVPCHRVMRGDGNLAGYRWGLERKRMLLEREDEQNKQDVQDATVNRGD